MSVLTEPPLVPLPAFGSTPGRPVDAAKASCLPGPRGCAHSGCAYSARCRSGPHQQEAERAATWGRRPLLDGVGEVCKGRRDRALGCVGLSPLRSARYVPPYQATAEARCDGVGRRPKTPPDDQDERSPARATAAAACGFSHRARGNGTAVAHARRHKHCKHGCGDDCWRSASLAAPHARPPALH